MVVVTDVTETWMRLIMYVTACFLRCELHKCEGSLCPFPVHVCNVVLTQPPRQQKGLPPVDIGLKSPRLVTFPLYFQVNFIKDKILHNILLYLINVAQVSAVDISVVHYVLSLCIHSWLVLQFLIIQRSPQLSLS